MDAIEGTRLNRSTPDNTTHFICSLNTGTRQPVHCCMRLVLIIRCRCSCGSQCFHISLCYIFVEACASFSLFYLGMCFFLREKFCRLKKNAYLCNRFSNTTAFFRLFFAVALFAALPPLFLFPSLHRTAPTRKPPVLTL